MSYLVAIVAALAVVAVVAWMLRARIAGALDALEPDDTRTPRERSRDEARAAEDALRGSLGGGTSAAAYVSPPGAPPGARVFIRDPAIAASGIRTLNQGTGAGTVIREDDRYLRMSIGGKPATDVRFESDDTISGKVPYWESTALPMDTRARIQAKRAGPSTMVTVDSGPFTVASHSLSEFSPVSDSDRLTSPVLDIGGL